MEKLTNGALVTPPLYEANGSLPLVKRPEGDDVSFIYPAELVYPFIWLNLDLSSPHTPFVNPMLPVDGNLVGFF